MEIREITLDELVNDPSFEGLSREYHEESGNPDLGKARGDLDVYRKREAAGLLRLAGAYGEDGNLVGWVSVFPTEHIHYSRPIAVLDTVFLSKRFRLGPAGLKLLHKAYGLAASVGADGIYMSAPAGSRLEKLLSRISKPKDVVFWKKL